MHLTATELAQKLLEQAPLKPYIRVRMLIERFLKVDTFLAHEEAGGRFSVTLGDDIPRWLWIRTTSTSVTLCWQWGDIVDDHTFSYALPDVDAPDRYREKRRYVRASSPSGIRTDDGSSSR